MRPARSKIKCFATRMHKLRIGGSAMLLIFGLGMAQAVGAANFSLSSADIPVCDARTVTFFSFFFGGIRVPVRSESTTVWQDIVRNQMGVAGFDPEHDFIGRFAAEKDLGGDLGRTTQVLLCIFGGPFGCIVAVGSEAVSEKVDDNWWPIDGYKHTLCGSLGEFNFYTNPNFVERQASGAREEADWNNFFSPGQSHAYILEQPKSQYLGADWHHCGGGIHIDVGSQRALANCLEAEVTPDERYYENVLNSRSAGTSVLEGHQGNTLCTYGPWVREKYHDNRPEIHPSEQYWWLETNVGTNEVWRYFLMQVQDDSDRFDRRGDYKGASGSFRPWTEPPLGAEFRIAFELDPAAEPVNFDIFDQDALNVVTNEDPSFSQDADDGTEHAIEYDGEVVLSVTEHQPDDNLAVNFLGVCRNEADTRLQGYMTIRSRIGVNDRGREGIHTIRVETNPLPYFTARPAFSVLHPPRTGSQPGIQDTSTFIRVVLDFLRQISGSSSTTGSAPSAQAPAENPYLVADLHIQLIGGPQIDPADLSVLAVKLISGGEVRDVTFEPGPDGAGAIVREVPVSERATIQLMLASGAIETVPVNGFNLSPVVLLKEPVASQSVVDPALWSEMTRIAGSLQETVQPPGTLQRLQSWRLSVAPFYAPLREGRISPGEESPITEEINKAIFEGQGEELEQLFGTGTPFDTAWSFRATNLSTNDSVPVVVDAPAASNEVQVQLMRGLIPNSGIEVTFPAPPVDASEGQDDVYELEATATITDTNGMTNIVRQRLWSHALSTEGQQLAPNFIPAVGELASETPQEILSASSTRMSGESTDSVGLSDNLLTKIRQARMVRLGLRDFAREDSDPEVISLDPREQNNLISIDELRDLVRGARLFTPDDPICLGVPATMVGTDSPELLTGTATDDVILAGAGSDTIVSGGGDDIICGNTGADFVQSGTGEDIVDGGLGADELVGGPDADELGGGIGNDTLSGGRGFDDIIGGFGHDEIEGGPGSDTIDESPGNDDISTGPGDDTCISDEEGFDCQ